MTGSYEHKLELVAWCLQIVAKVLFGHVLSLSIFVFEDKQVPLVLKEWIVFARKVHLIIFHPMACKVEGKRSFSKDSDKVVLGSAYSAVLYVVLGVF